MFESIESVVIGAGHAGLSTSYFLKKSGHEHVILDKGSRAGNAWRSERWDSFTFVSPNWTFQIPGGEYDGPDPDGFMTRDELIQRFDQYTQKYQLPILFDTTVISIQDTDTGEYLVKTQNKTYRARNVVTANGWFQVGKKPLFSGKIPAAIFQIHSSGYRNPLSLPPGAILVVGSGQSGAQIAEELNQSGRKVFLATGTAPHAPRRYRGQDTFKWLVESGFADQTYTQMQYLGRSFVAPMLSGKAGGHALNLHIFFREGIILLGHVRDYEDGKIILDSDVNQNLAKADMGQKYILSKVDEYIQRARIDAPQEDMPALSDGYRSPEITRLDLAKEGITTIIWACGYSYDAAMFEFPVLDSNGLPDAPRGVSQAHPGIYFVGFPFLPTLKSGFFAGVAHCAASIVDNIENRKSGL